MIRVLSIVGARPQFIKAAALHHAPHPGIEVTLLHTGQHYDTNMSADFFSELRLPAPTANLGIAGTDPHTVIPRMEQAISTYLHSAPKPDWIQVYGDTSSTLAGAHAARKHGIPLMHIEAGLRSYNTSMPEERIRTETDHLSALLCCPTESAVQNLARENIHSGVHHTGDIMLDIARIMQPAITQSDVLARYNLKEKHYILATLHRAALTDNPTLLHSTLKELATLARFWPVIVPLHPRTHAAIDAHGLAQALAGITTTPPLSYTDTARLLQSATCLITDSGGMQKEAYIYRTPCIVARSETEWPEALQHGQSCLSPPENHSLHQDTQALLQQPAGHYPPVFGNGHAAEKIWNLLAA